MGSPGVKGEKGEPGGYYDPRYGGIGVPGTPGPPVREPLQEHHLFPPLDYGIYASTVYSTYTYYKI